MKRIAAPLFIVAAIFFSASASAQDYRLALGIRLSNATPTLSNSLSVKYFATDKTAIEGLISFGDRFGLGGLIEIHKPLNAPGLKWFFGAGAYVGFQSSPNETYVGPTGVVGLDYKFTDIPLDLSLDWKPELDIVPAVNFVPDAFGFTVRFTLK